VSLTPRFHHGELVAAVRDALIAAGAALAISSREAEVMVEADLLGVPSHGVIMLPGVLRGIRIGAIRATPKLQLVSEHAAVCVLDGDLGPGRYVAAEAMMHAVERAKTYGIGACLAVNTLHWGRAHAYAYRAAKAGMIGICTTNASVHMLAFGSRTPLLGNNPLAIGVPRKVGEHPIVLDMAMSQAAIGKIQTYLREGHEVPAGWGLDAADQPTQDTEAVLAAHKFLPMGEHKGAALSIMFELLTGALAGGLLCYEIGPADWGGQDANCSKLFLAIDVDAFVERGRFEERVEALLAYLEQAGADNEQVSVNRTPYPGQRGWQAMEKNLKQGVPIHPEIVAQLERAGVRLPTPVFE